MIRFRPLAALLALTVYGCAPRGMQDTLQRAVDRSPLGSRTPSPTGPGAESSGASNEAGPGQAPEIGLATPARAQTPSNLPLRLPAPARLPVLRDARVADLKFKISKYKLFAAYRQLAQLYVSAGLYAEAARTYREEAAQYRRKGLTDAAIIGEKLAARYDNGLGLYIERDATPQEVKGLYSGAPLEPFVGCYLGAFIDRDDALREKYLDENFQTHKAPEEWARLTGKPHGTMFMYLSYGNKFPRAWVERLKQNNIIPQIAWEPRDLRAVRDDKYLQEFAQACREVDWPIFFRFASEMNGAWTPYHGNPALYREKFRLVHRVLHRYAPRVATIWCVNNPPLGPIDAYYPGDDGCDWVGVNFYSVPFYENNRARPAFDDSPLALLDPVYKKYAARKPIAICEYAASHRPALDNVLRNDFAIQKLSILYGALPRLYPRVKLIDWFSMSTIAHPTPGKTLNDYTLSDQKAVLDAYRRVTAAPYFLPSFQRLGEARPPLPRALRSNEPVRGSARLSAWSNLQLTGTKVFATLGDRVVYASNRPGAHEIALDLARTRAGSQAFTVLVYDSKNRFVASKGTVLNVRP
jgi:hypothetical protein